jgi:hypothetical protein
MTGIQFGRSSAHWAVQVIMIIHDDIQLLLATLGYRYFIIYQTSSSLRSLRKRPSAPC